MKKEKKSLLLTVLLVISMIAAMSLGVFAAQSDSLSKDGLTAQLFTDKDAYVSNESVAVTVRVDNQTGKEVSIVTTINVPENVKLANERAEYEVLLKQGETWTTPEIQAGTEGETAGSEAETEGEDVETGDITKNGLWIVLAVLSVGTIIALLVVGKNRKIWISMILCVIMIGGLVTEAISAQAADLSGEIQLSCTISVDGKDEVVTAIVSYVIHDVEEPDEEPSARLEALIAHAENVLKYGRNIEGALYPQLFVDGIDPVTKEATIWSKFNSEKYYVSNLFTQTNLLKMLEGLTSITGDEKYQEAAYDQIQIRFDTPGLVDDNGLLYAGGHCFVDVTTGQKWGTGPDLAAGLAYHEVKINLLPIEMYAEVDLEGFKDYVTAAWNAHVYDPSNLAMNRHAEYNIPMTDFWNMEYTDPSPYVESQLKPFISTSADLIEMAYYLTEKTGDPIYQTWGERLLDKYIGVTDEKTGLTGIQYGRFYIEQYDTWDYFLHNFAGAEFVDANGVDYRTLTEDDYAICGDTTVLNRANVRVIHGYAMQTFMQLYEMTGQQKLYDLVKGNMLGFVRYIYDPDIHKFKTPISTNGTDFNPGGDGSVLVAPRGGDYLAEGKSFKENESISDVVFISLIDAVHMLKDEDAAERAELWEAARAWAKNAGLGDIGTAMGENVDVNLETTTTSADHVLAVLSLYKYTRHEQYYDLAVKIADNILEKCFDEETGLFTPTEGAPYVKFASTEMYAVFCVEAMTQGMIDEISFDMPNKGTEAPHEGYSNKASDTEVFYNREKIAVKDVNLGGESYSLILDQAPNLIINDVAGHTCESAIRQMVALGVMGVDANGNFAPDAKVTGAELLQMVLELFGFDNADGLIDENLSGTGFDGDRIATREEMASVIVRALKAATPEKTYYVADALYRIEDADGIADWARDYVDIATNCRLMIDITESVFNPKADVTKAMVAYAFQNLCRYIEVEGLESLTAVITPNNADSQIVTWETSDNTVLEVDQKGRLYPLKVGEAVITATADTKSVQIKVTVAEKEDWMIKSVTFNGETLAEFNACTMEYNVNLHLGTTQIPTITAVSFSGAPVEVKLPDALPGVVEFKVQGSEVKYTINVDNTLVEYGLYQNFDQVEIGTPINETYTDQFIWDIRGSNAYYNPYCTVVSTNAVESGKEGGSLSFPYLYDLGVKNMSRILLNEEYRYVFGPEQDEMLLVIELDFAVKDMEGKTNGYDIAFAYDGGGGSNYFAYFDITKNQIRRCINGKATQYSEDSIRTIEDNRFYNLRLVVDKKAKTMSYYLDGVLLEKDVAFWKDTATGFGMILFYNYLEKEECKDCEASMFFDNIKAYELQRSVVEEGSWPQESVQSPE